MVSGKEVPRSTQAGPRPLEQSVEADNSGGLIVSNTLFLENVGVGLEIGTGNVSNSIFRANGGGGLVCLLGPNQGAQIANCTFENHLTPDTSGATVSHSSVLDCSFRNCWRGIHGGFGSTIQRCTLTRITEVGIELDDKCLAVGNNCTGLTTGTGILVQGSGAHNVLKDNRISFFDTGVSVTSQFNMIGGTFSSENATHYNIGPSNSYGTIIDLTGIGTFINTEPAANFIH